MQMYPVMYPGAQDQEQNRGAGLYAVPFDPHMRLIAGVPPTLIPLTYSIPTRRAHEAGASGEENGQVGQQQQQQNVHQQPQHQRQVVVRRFQIAIQLDLLLILKLAAVIFLFNQDGSRQRLIVLIFFASLVYLYQTGALSPLVRWLSQGMQRAAQPPHPPRPAAVAGGLVPPAPGQVNEDRGLAGEGQDGAENENQVENDENRAAADNENAAEPPAANNQLWAIVKEIQMIVFGFIASLLPGFHNID